MDKTEEKKNEKKTEATNKKYKVIVSSLNIRSGMKPNDRVNRIIFRDDIIVSIKDYKDYILTKYGYVRKEYIKEV